MKTFEIQYPANTRYQNQRNTENLMGDKGRTINYSTPEGAFSVHRTEQGISSVYINKETGRSVTQDVRGDIGDVFSAKVTTVSKGKHSCQSVQTLMKDGTYTVERFVDDVSKGGYTYKPESRQFKGLKGFLERAVLWLSTDINGCEKVKVAPIAHRLLAKIRHF